MRAMNAPRQRCLVAGTRVEDSRKEDECCENEDNDGNERMRAGNISDEEYEGKEQNYGDKEDSSRGGNDEKLF